MNEISAHRVYLHYKAT